MERSGNGIVLGDFSGDSGKVGDRLFRGRLGKVTGVSLVEDASVRWRWGVGICNYLVLLWERNWMRPW